MINELCLAAVLINISGFDWDKHDKKIFKRAEYVCANDKRYEDTPCVRKFIKKEERVYNVICGAY